MSLTILCPVENGNIVQLNAQQTCNYQELYVRLSYSSSLFKVVTQVTFVTFVQAPKQFMTTSVSNIGQENVECLATRRNPSTVAQ
jgi:hypothetical protein